MINNESTNLSDYEVIHKILNGEKEYFAIIIKRYQSYIFCIINRLVLNNEDKKDLAQEIITKVYYSLPQYNIKYNFKNWVYKIAINYVLDYLRKKNSKKNSDNNVSFVDISDCEYLFCEEENFKILEVKEEFNKVVSLINKLKPKYREVILLRFIEGLKIDEISEILKISCNNVKTRISRAIKMLKNFLKTCNPF
ncbi:MAG: sigma-70 family RNA polymerase sigma factor [Endomicrobia bacterium]|nr:sigma-70 family RNA polymerase sigma factor [Endomicrobiia bacterium]